jgi:hypothetical protein
MEERRENKRRVDCVVEMPGAYLPILIPSSLSMLTPVSTFAFPSPFFSLSADFHVQSGQDSDRRVAALLGRRPSGEGGEAGA